MQHDSQFQYHIIFNKETLSGSVYYNSLPADHLQRTLPIKAHNEEMANLRI